MLTKRSERLRGLLQTKLRDSALEPHLWWGVSVEDRKYGLPRIDHLRAAPARMRFLSIEPLLEDLGPINLAGIGWVIVGGESGHGARPMDPAWVRSIRDQCRASGVPFFFKQWGGVNKKMAGRELDGSTYDEMPARHGRPSPGRTEREKLAREIDTKARSFTAAFQAIGTTARSARPQQSDLQRQGRG